MKHIHYFCRFFHSVFSFLKKESEGKRKEHAIQPLQSQKKKKKSLEYDKINHPGFYIFPAHKQSDRPSLLQVIKSDHVFLLRLV
jgi:hypothetical protein